MNGIIYCRVSSKEQIEGTSLEVQERACREYAEAHRIKVLKVFIERGESAKFADRPQLLELIEFCRTHKGQADVLIVWKVDRFARNVGDHFNIKATLLKYGVQIASVTEPIDSNPEGKLMETILAGFAQFDNDIRAVRTVQGMRRKLQEGVFPWGPPLGYQGATQSGPKKTEPDQPKQPLFGLLQQAWRELASGAYTKAEIGRLLTSWGVLTERGRPLSPQSIDVLFRNPFYAGILIDPWSQEEHQGRHLPMVTREDFAAVQQVIARRNRSRPHHKEREEFPLRGLVRCQECRRPLTASFSKGRSARYPYYHCNKTSCRDRRTYAAQAVHEEFAALLDRIAAKPELFDRLREAIVRGAERRQVFIRARRARRETEVARLNRNIQELIRMRTDGLVTDEEFLSQKALLSDRRNAFEATGSVEEVSLGKVTGCLNEIMEPLSQLRRTWDDLPLALRRRFQRLVIPVGFVCGESGTPNWAVFSGFSAISTRRIQLGCPSVEKVGTRLCEKSWSLRTFLGRARPQKTRLQPRFQLLQPIGPRRRKWNHRRQLNKPADLVNTHIQGGEGWAEPLATMRPTVVRVEHAP